MHAAILAFGSTPEEVIHTIDLQTRIDGLGKLDKFRGRESDSVHENQGRNRRQDCMMSLYPQLLGAIMSLVPPYTLVHGA